MVSLTPHLSPADLSPVLSIERKLWNISVENQSFREQWSLETSKNTVFQSDSDHFLQENALGLTNTPPVGCEWHYNITGYHNVPIRLSVLTLTFEPSCDKHYKLKRLKSCASECEDVESLWFKFIQNFEFWLKSSISFLDRCPSQSTHWADSKKFVKQSHSWTIPF